MMTAPYLFFDGTCYEAMTLYAETLGGEVVAVFRNGDAPDPESRMPGDDAMVMHMAIRIGGGLVMASDSPCQYDKPQGFRLSAAPETLADFDRMHAALAEDAQNVVMAPGETFFAERFAMFTDRFGTPWMLNFAGSKATY